MRRKTGFRKGAGFFARTAALTAVLLWSLFPPFSAEAADRLQDPGEKLVVVIDPGHGGENLGTTENGHEEKSMTLTTALAMYQELSLYDGVEVYLTRSGDEDLTLEQRAAFAESVDADFLFSIHYNASVSHDLFGSEVWVSAFAPYNGYGFQFGNEILQDLRKKGLFLRGVKTRLGEKGTDYYGIIRCSVSRDIPAVIIEHCHVDEPGDAAFCDSEEKLREFGRMDATAVARYFGLKSSFLGVDYSDYPLAQAQDGLTVPVAVCDTTAPTECLIQLEDVDYSTGKMSVSVSASDPDSPLLYYAYSLDGGTTFEPREAWPGADALSGDTGGASFTLELTIPSGKRPVLVVRAYNQYDRYAESNVWESSSVFWYREDEETEDALAPAIGAESREEGEKGETQDASLAPGENPEPEGDGSVGNGGRLPAILAFCLAVLFALFVLLLLLGWMGRIRSMGRRQRRKEPGEKTNQRR